MMDKGLIRCDDHFQDGEDADAVSGYQLFYSYHAKEVMFMQIKAVKLYDNGFMTQALAFGGEGMDGIDPYMKYRSSLQNYVIDTGSEVILVDTGMPAEVPEQVPDEKTMIYMGKKVKSYVDALAEAGYKPEQVSRILITHKHADHTGELRKFSKCEDSGSESGM